MRRVSAAGVCVAVVAAWLTVAGGSPALEPAAAASCGPAPSGRVAVAVVVDDGQRVSTRCVEVPERASGYDVLVAAGHRLRIEAGFLCAIDGMPATGCGNRPDFAGAYWRYFHAAPGGEWVYSNVGAGGYRVPARCAIEGWRWSDQPSTGIAPRVAPPPVDCSAPAPVTTRPAGSAPVTRPTQPAAPTSSPSAGAPAPPVAPPRSPAEHPVAASGAPTAPAGSPDPESPAGEASPEDRGDAEREEVAGAVLEGPPPDGGGPDADRRSTSDERPSAPGGRRGASEVGAAVAPVGASPGAGRPPAGTLIGVVLVALVGTGAWWVARRRPGSNA